MAKPFALNDHEFVNVVGILYNSGLNNPDVHTAVCAIWERYKTGDVKNIIGLTYTICKTIKESRLY